MEYKENVLQEVIRQVFLTSRQKKGLTQSELSCISNITRQFISQVEVGKRQPSISTLSSLANAFDISLAYFFQEVDRLYPLIEHSFSLLNSRTSLAAESSQNQTSYIHNAKDFSMTHEP